MKVQMDLILDGETLLRNEFIILNVTDFFLRLYSSERETRFEVFEEKRNLLLLFYSRKVYNR